MLTRVVVVTLLGLAACQQEPTVPRLADAPVALSISLSDDSVRIGNPDTVRITATNRLERGVRLDFPSTCTIIITIRNRAGQVVLTDDDSECIRVPTSLTFAPLGTITRTQVWRGGTEFAPPDSPTRLPAGTYFVSASMNSFGYSTFAPALKIELLP